MGNGELAPLNYNTFLSKAEKYEGPYYIPGGPRMLPPWRWNLEKIIILSIKNNIYLRIPFKSSMF